VGKQYSGPVVCATYMVWENLKLFHTNNCCNARKLFHNNNSCNARCSNHNRNEVL